MLSQTLGTEWLLRQTNFNYQTKSCVSLLLCTNLPELIYSFYLYMFTNILVVGCEGSKYQYPRAEGGREGGRDGGKEGGREGGRKGGREGG